MSAVKLTIDGMPVEVAPGTTILEAARKLEIDIPTFCHDPELTRNGACRMCVVEVEKARALVASCCTPVAPDMVVHTDSARVRTARQTILRLILANHPLECITCEKTGDCRLQDYCYRYGVSESGFQGETKDLPLDDTNPFFIRDMNKCILCGICVGKCQEINGAGAIDFTRRGFVTNVSPPFGDPIENSSCVFCGMCVDACPVGALVPEAGVGKGRPWEIEKVKTICPYCGTGCSVYLHVKDGKIIGASPDAESPVNRGHLCAKGRFGWDFVHSEERLTRPLIRRNGVFVEAGWDEALDLVASRLKESIARYGPDAFMGLSSAKTSNEDNYLFQKLVRHLGTNNVDHCARL
jgi:formate dehydrogenase alpha subunit